MTRVVSAAVVTLALALNGCTSTASAQRFAVTKGAQDATAAFLDGPNVIGVWTRMQYLNAHTRAGLKCRGGIYNSIGCTTDFGLFYFAGIGPRDRVKTTGVGFLDADACEAVEGYVMARMGEPAVQWEGERGSLGWHTNLKNRVLVLHPFTAKSQDCLIILSPTLPEMRGIPNGASR